MISILIFLIFLFVIFLSIYIKRQTIFIKDRLGDVKVNFKNLNVEIFTFISAILISIIQPFSLKRVDAGCIGIKVKLIGNERGISEYQYKTGWVIINTWLEKLYEFPTYQQHIEYEEQVVITKGGFQTTIKPTFNYSLVPESVADMFLNLRLSISDIEKGWLKTAIVGAINDEANKWTVDSIFNYRENFENSIINEANKKVNKWFLISQLRTNISPPSSLLNSIEEKTKAIQEVQIAENKKKVAIAEAEMKIAIARGDSARMVINALAEAETYKIKLRQLTPLYIEYLKIEKWDGQLPSTILGSNPIISISK